MTSLCLIIESDAGRSSFLDRIAAELGEDMCLVRIADVIGMRREMKTTPKDSAAILVAKETPLILRGGLTSLVFYYVIPRDSLEAVEVHSVGGQQTHQYPVVLHIARWGRKPVASNT